MKRKERIFWNETVSVSFFIMINLINSINYLLISFIAALKCRQRKKQWLNNLQARVDYLANDNDQLQMETDALRKEIMDLKTLLVSHKECPQYNTALMNNSTVQHQTQPVYHHNFSMSN